MLFHFNEHSAPLLFGFLQGIIYATLLIYRGSKKDRLSDKLLAGILLACSAIITQYMLGFGGWYDSRDAYSTFMFYFPFHQLLIVGPLVYFYFRSLTNHDFQLRKKDWWHFVPWALLMTFYLVSFLGDVVVDHWILGNEMPGHSGTQGALSQMRQGIVTNISEGAGMISSMVYMVLTIRQYQQYKTYVFDNFSETEHIEFRWLRIVLVAFLLGLGINWVFDFLMIFTNFTYAQNWNSFMVFALMIYVISIPGYSVSQQLPVLDFEPQEEEKEKTKALMPEIESYKSRLQTLMHNEKPYLDSGLTLSFLAKLLKTNPSVLSKVINSGFGKNFNDFINAYRVRAVQEKLQSEAYAHYTLTSVAYECGFNSKATFNRAFKKVSGMSPKQFLEQGVVAEAV